MGTCLSSLSAALDGTCLGWEVPLLIAVATSGYCIYWWAWKQTKYKVHNFRLTILLHEPNLSSPASFAEEPQCLKILPCGDWQDIFIKVRASCGFRMKKVNCRLLEYGESNAGLKHQVQIGEVREICVPGFYQSLNDGAHGQEYEYGEPKVLAEGEGIYLKVKLRGREEWNGLLSFRAQDDTGFRSRARYAIAFRNV